MYDTLHRLYLAGSLSDAGLQNAVTKGWITQDQADQIRVDKAAQNETPVAAAARKPEHPEHPVKPEQLREVLDAVVVTLLED